MNRVSSQSLPAGARPLLALAATFSLVLTLLLADISQVAAQYDVCGVNQQQSATCPNSLTIQNTLTYYQHEMNDYFDAPDAYHIHFTSTNWHATVFRGSPMYLNYYIYDNFNGQTIFYSSDYNGRFLADYSQITMGTNATSGYYPDNGNICCSGSPGAVLEIQDADPGGCAGNPLCGVNNQASQFGVY